MPVVEFQLPAVIRVLPGGGYLGEVPGVSEVSALGDDREVMLRLLAAKVRGILEDAELVPAAQLHRRVSGVGAKASSMALEFEAPKRDAEWRDSVVISLAYVQWVADGWHQAFLPSLGVRVLAARPEELEVQIREHVRLVLATRSRHLSLKALEALAGSGAVETATVEIEVRRTAPLQLAKPRETSREEGAALRRVAEELPARLERRSEAMEEPAFELESELARVAEVLREEPGRSVLLVGPHGGGKTALVRELARRRAEFGFGHTTFWATSAARLMTGGTGFGMWQERCQELCRDASRLRAVLHLGPLGEWLEVGKVTRGGQSAGGFLTPWLVRGQVRAVAEVTPEQLGWIEKNDPHLLGAFDQVIVAERTPEQTRAILGQVYAAMPGRRWSDEGSLKEGLDRLHALHLRYAAYSGRPGRPLRFLRRLMAERFPEKRLTESEVVAEFSRETGLPLDLLDDGRELSPARTRDWFVSRVVGQEAAVERVVDLLVTVKARLARPRKPLGTFLFIGPTGTGKTEMAKTLAEFLYGDATRLVRFDLNEYGDADAVERLVGGGSGGKEGLLTARVREQPFGVVLLDEFEKAHPALFDLLLQVLGEGRLTDAAGRVADFCNSIVIMTSNLGAQEARRGKTGFGSGPDAGGGHAEPFEAAVREFLRPELYNRIDAIVPFAPLPPEVVRRIAGRMLDDVLRRDGLRLRPVECEVRPGVVEHLAERGCDPRYGARPLKRLVEREVLVPLAEALNGYEASLPLRVEIGVERGRLQLVARPVVRGKIAPEDGFASARQLGEDVMQFRRRVFRLARSRAATAVEDAGVWLAMQEKRSKARGWIAPELQARLRRWPRLREAGRQLGELAERVERWEAEVLGAVYGRGAVSFPKVNAERDALEAERHRLARELFALQYESPGEVVVAMFGNPREAMVELFQAYFGGAEPRGRLVELDYFVASIPRRGAKPEILRKTAKDREAFLAEPVAGAFGILAKVRGELALPIWKAEEGLHLIRRGERSGHVWVECFDGAFDDYRPPLGIERSGGVQTKGQALRRSFLGDKDVVRDAVLGERVWEGGGIAVAAGHLIDERLVRDIEEATGGERGSGGAA